MIGPRRESNQQESQPQETKQKNTHTTVQISQTDTRPNSHYLQDRSCTTTRNRSNGGRKSKMQKTRKGKGQVRWGAWTLTLNPRVSTREPQTTNHAQTNRVTHQRENGPRRIRGNGPLRLENCPLRGGHGPFWTRERGHYERGLFAGGISRISRSLKFSKFSGIFGSFFHILLWCCLSRLQLH